MKNQDHKGKGDNVGRDKIINIGFKIDGIYIILTLIVMVGIYVLVNDDKPIDDKPIDDKPIDDKPIDKNPININGYVLFKDQNPVPGAQIKIFKGDTLDSETLSSDNGEFNFKGVSKIANITNLEVVFSSESFLFDSEELNFGNLNNNIVIQLDTVIKPFRVTYYNVYGEALEDLFHGPSDNTTLFNSGIMKTEPFEILYYLRSKYSYDWNDIVEIKKKHYPEILKDKDSDSIASESGYNPFDNPQFIEDHLYERHGLAPEDFEPYFPGSGYFHPSEFFDTGELYKREISMDQALAALKDKKLGWQVKFDSITSYDHSIRNWRFAKLSELSKFDFQSKYLDLLKEITKGVNLKDFLINQINSISWCNEEGGSSTIYYLSWFPPVLKLHLVEIENISNRNIFINKLLIKRQNEKKLRLFNDDRKYYNSTNNLINYEIPSTILKQGESFLLPLYLYFEHDYKINYYGNMSFHNEAIKESFFSQTTENIFIYGNSIKLEKIEFGNYTYTARQYNPEDLGYYIGDGLDGGSCPYAYTYSDKYNKWILENHILYGVNKKSMERFDTISLSRFNGKLLVKEIDPETSYIDFLQILEVDHEKKMSTLICTDSLLQKVDGKYLIMNQGDSILVNFSKYKGSKTSSLYYLVSKGYYETYKSQ